MRPAVGSSKPAIIRSVVVFPDPDGPSIEKNSPSRTSRSTPATAMTSPKRFSTPMRRTATGGGVFVGGAGTGRSAIESWVSVGAAKRGLLADARTGRTSRVGDGFAYGAGVRCAVSSRSRDVSAAGTGPAPYDREMSTTVRRSVLASVALVALAVSLVACASASPMGPTAASGAPSPGTEGTPRAVNVITKDDVFLPDALVLYPGETVMLHVINGGLQTHEAVIGDGRVQDAGETAEAATVGAPPGPTPLVSVPPDVRGIRIVVTSGQLVDLRWTIPSDAPSSPSTWVVGCHIPGHWGRGMQIPVRWAAP